MDQQRKPEEYEFNRVAFAINLSPFQAQFVSQTHAEKHKDELPLVAEALSKSTYMDDSMDSVLDDSQGIELYKQLDELWSKAGMHARKWLSSSSQVLEKIPIKDRASRWTSTRTPSNSKDIGNHVASRGRHIYVQSKSARRELLAHQTEFPKENRRVI